MPRMCLIVAQARIRLGPQLTPTASCIPEYEGMAGRQQQTLLRRNEHDAHSRDQNNAWPCSNQQSNEFMAWSHLYPPRIMLIRPCFGRTADRPCGRPPCPGKGGSTWWASCNLTCPACVSVHLEQILLCMTRHLAPCRHLACEHPSGSSGGARCLGRAGSGSETGQVPRPVDESACPCGNAGAIQTNLPVPSEQFDILHLSC